MVQFFHYLYKAVRHGDIGYSYVTKNPVAQEVLAAFPATVKLATIAVILSVCLGVPFGIISAVKQYSFFDSFVMFFAMVGVSMTIFWLGLLMILFFSVQLGWLPSSGFDTFSSQIADESAKRAARLLDHANDSAERWISSNTISQNEVVAVWRDAYKRFKTKKGARVSVENLIKRVMKDNPVRHINPALSSPQPP